MESGICFRQLSFSVCTPQQSGGKWKWPWPQPCRACGSQGLTGRKVHRGPGYYVWKESGIDSWLLVQASLLSLLRRVLFSWEILQYYLQNLVTLIRVNNSEMVMCVLSKCFLERWVSVFQLVMAGILLIMHIYSGSLYFWWKLIYL